MKTAKIFCFILVLMFITVGCEKKPTKSLHQAATDGDIEQVKLNISKGIAIDAKDTNGQTALHLATKNGNQDIVEMLTDKGANVDAKDMTGGTALHWAIWNGHSDIAKLLINKGVIIDNKNSHGATPLYYASVRGDVATVKLLLEKGAQIDIFAASALGDIDRITAFLENDPNLTNTKGSGSFTLLYCAAAAGQKAIAELLIANGANVNEKIHTGAIALHAAVSNNHVAVADLLITESSDINAKIERLGGCTALHNASAKGLKAMVELLIDRGADVNSETDDGMTPLDWAQKKERNTEIVELLRKHGAKE